LPRFDRLGSLSVHVYHEVVVVLTKYKVTRRLREKLTSREAEPFRLSVELNQESLMSLIPKPLFVKEATIAVERALKHVGFPSPSSHPERLLKEQEEGYRRPAFLVFEVLSNYREIEIDNTWANDRILLTIPVNLSDPVLDMMLEEITRLKEVNCVDAFELKQQA